MANYYGTTTSNGGKIHKKDHKKIQAIMDKYTFEGDDDGLSIELGEEISIYGYTSPYAYKIDDEEHDEEVFDQFLQELAPFVKTPLVVSEVGNEKCRYVCAYAYVVRPNKKVVSVSLDEAINKVLKIK